MCSGMFSQVQKRTRLNSVIRERLTKFWEIKTWNEDETPWKKLTEKLICSNTCLYLVTQNPRKIGWHPGFVFLAELALRSGDYIETCDINRKKHSCRCYALPGLHKPISAPPRPFDARDATTQKRDLKHTKCHHLDLTRSITKWEAMCSRSLTQSACAFPHLNAVCIGTTYEQVWIVRESESLGSPSSHACLRAFVHGWTRWAGWPELVRCERGTHNRGVLGLTLAKNGVVIRPAGLEVPEQIARAERRGAMLNKMMSKVIKDTHASGRESMDMILSECLNTTNEVA